MLLHNQLSAIIHHLSHMPDKAVAAPRYGLYISIVAIALAKRFSQRKYVVGQVSFLDKAVGPEPPHQFFFLKQVPAVLNKHYQHVEGLGSDGHHLPVSQQEALCCVQAERAELVEVL